MTVRRWLIIAGAAAILLALVTWGVVVTIDRDKMAALLRQAAEARGIPGDWAVAIGIVESNLDPNATNLTGGDLARGGAWGATQITLKTAQAYGYTGTGPELLADPARQAELTATILAAGNPQTIADVAAWWNAGRKSLSSAPAVTQNTYAPRLAAALDQAEGIGLS